VNYRIFVSHEAEKVLDRLDRPFERGSFKNGDDPFDPRRSTPLTERAGVRKSRVGSWRILFTVDRDAMVVHVLTVDTRGQVYKHS
jgi:mRNA-degrading endonuclease RelE of RelBE toxin-antitoxin system